MTSRSELCEDEGCPHHDTSHVCITRQEPWFEVECIRCEELVHEDNTYGGMCQSCIEQAHERQEMYR